VNKGYDNAEIKTTSFSASLNFEPPAFENAARYPNAETNLLCRNDRTYASSKLGEVGSTHLWERLLDVPHP